MRKYILPLGFVLALALVLLPPATQTGPVFFAVIYKLAYYGAVLILSILTQIIIHQLGHTIFGLANNYEFLGFQVLGLTLMVENKRLVFRNTGFNVALGASIMIPKNQSDEDNHINYYRGGYLANFASLVSLVLALAFFPMIKLEMLIF